MREIAPALCLLVLLSGCSTAPLHRVSLATQEDGTRSVTIQEDLDRPRAEELLLFYAAAATLESGSRYFRVTGRTSSAVPLDERTPRSNSRPEFALLFRTVPSPDDLPELHDSRQVVLEADPALRAQLSGVARGTLERIESTKL